MVVKGGKFTSAGKKRILCTNIYLYFFLGQQKYENRIYNNDQSMVYSRVVCVCDVSTCLCGFTTDERTFLKCFVNCLPNQLLVLELLLLLSNPAAVAAKPAARKSQVDDKNSSKRFSFFPILLYVAGHQPQDHHITFPIENVRKRGEITIKEEEEEVAGMFVCLFVCCRERKCFASAGKIHNRRRRRRENI